MGVTKVTTKRDKIKLCAVIINLSAAIIEEKKKSRRKMWQRKWLARRNKLGCYENLMKELALEVFIYFYTFQLCLIQLKFFA